MNFGSPGSKDRQLTLSNSTLVHSKRNKRRNHVFNLARLPTSHVLAVFAKELAFPQAHLLAGFFVSGQETSLGEAIDCESRPTCEDAGVELVSRDVHRALMPAPSSSSHATNQKIDKCDRFDKSVKAKWSACAFTDGGHPANPKFWNSRPARRREGHGQRENKSTCVALVARLAPVS